MFNSLSAAIELQKKAQLSGQELFVFPMNLLPEKFDPVGEVDPEPNPTIPYSIQEQLVEWAR